MFEIDKAKFGAFVAQLRKEKGLMQKELAEKLYVSDKAVSKWERGLSIPDVAILVPLAEILGVTVTELLECRRLPKDEPMDSQQTEEIVKKVIRLSDNESISKPAKAKHALCYLFAILVSSLEIYLMVLMGENIDEISYSVSAPMMIFAMFGVYFFLFSKNQVPKYYDENKISAYYYGAFRFNLPGLYINNGNIKHIMRVGRYWTAIGLVTCPMLYAIIKYVFAAVLEYSMMITSFVAIVGLLVPMYIVGKKYE